MGYLKGSKTKSIEKKDCFPPSKGCFEWGIVTKIAETVKVPRLLVCKSVACSASGRVLSDATAMIAVKSLSSVVGQLPDGQSHGYASGLWRTWPGATIAAP